VRPDTPAQMASHCSCSAPLRWEWRESFGRRASVAVCSNDDCGVVTTALPEGVEPDKALESYLLGSVPPRPYLRPWLRLYWKATQWGFRWCAHHETCPACDSAITTQLGLPRLAERPGDPYEVLLCLTCGATTIAWWMFGERVAVALEGDEWNEPATALLILRRVLQERADLAAGHGWDFER
jgi:hypothetical protein